MGEAQGAGAGLVDGMALDPYDIDSARAFVSAFKQRPGRQRLAHGLVHAPVEHEAGTAHAPVDFPVGADRALVANHLAPFLLTQLMLPLLLHSTPARIVLVAGPGHASGDRRWQAMVTKMPCTAADRASARNMSR